MATTGRDGGPGVLQRDSRDITFEVRPTQAPPPMPTAPSVQLLPGRARLVGTHESACSNQMPASGNGDRWCAFSLPAQQIGKTELWVINMTKAAGGTKVSCDPKNPTADPNCKKLTDDLWTGVPDAGPAHPTAHRFDGDTLIFHAAADPNVALYKGNIYAWRPGWAEAKVVSSSNKAITCSAHFRSEAVVCLENITPDTVMPTQFDLTAGPLSTGAQFVQRLTPLRANGNASQWRAAFSRDGQWFAWSTGGKTVQEPETLKVVKIGDIGNDAKTITVGTGISRWTISVDGKRWYYLKDYNYSTEGDPKGTLMTASFPNGGDDKMLAPNVGAFQLMFDGTENDRGIGFFDAVAVSKGTFKIMADVTKPDAVTTVIKGVSGALVSPDQRFVFFSKDFDQMNGTSDAYIVKTDGTGQCPLQTNQTTDIFGPAFNKSATMVFWVDNIDPATDVGEGWMANPDGCQNKKRWAPTGIDFWFIQGNQGMVYSDHGNGDNATLNYVDFPGGNSLGTPKAVAQQVDRVFGILPNFDIVAYTITRMTMFDGLFQSPLPFKAESAGGTTTPPPATDGGAPAPAADAAAKD